MFVYFVVPQLFFKTFFEANQLKKGKFHCTPNPLTWTNLLRSSRPFASLSILNFFIQLSI